MTVDDLHYTHHTRVRVRGEMRGASNNDNDAEERWRVLAHLEDGRREKWMTDRAKNALGTAK